MRRAGTFPHTLLCGLLALNAGCTSPPVTPEPNATALRLLVMDPLADQIACDCVAGYAHRDYDRFGTSLSAALSRPVTVHYADDLRAGLDDIPAGHWLVIGKDSVVRHDAKALDMTVSPLARLKGLDGTTDLHGLFIAMTDSPVKRLEDIRDQRLRFGPPGSIEKDGLARDALTGAGIPIPAPLPRSADCTAAALAVVDGEADIAVVSSYALPLVEGCGAIQPGRLKVIGQTAPAPFITVFTPDAPGPAERQAILAALLMLNKDQGLLKAMESKGGFVPVEMLPAVPAPGWTDWRGPGRKAFSPAVPQSLARAPRLLWHHPTSGTALAGVCADATRVIVADKSADETCDIFRCLRADTGEEIWQLSYTAAGEMDYTNTPRATPVLHDGLVILLGAFGDLHAVSAEDGRVVWKRDLRGDFGAELPIWGFTSTPLVAGDRLIVNPGAPLASLVALDVRTGNILWQTPGPGPAYASFLLGFFGGQHQIVGYDADSLGGWDPATGQRLWRLPSAWKGDFQVPTPVVVENGIVLTSQGDGTVLHRFDSEGRIRVGREAIFAKLAPDTATPVLAGGTLFGCCESLYGLDVSAGLKPLVKLDDPVFDDFCSMIAGPGRLLILSASGELLLLPTDSQSGGPKLERVQLFDTEQDIWSHPALVGPFLYVRAPDGVYCFMVGQHA